MASRRRVLRTLAPTLRGASRKYPVVTVIGPRQSGKTTLCRAVFPRKRYVSLEDLDIRERALTDPRGLLADLAAGAILDEIQRAPGLLSYLQTEVDRDRRPGRFVLTGSEQLGLSAGISQTLAGRTAVLHLLPLSREEVLRFAHPPAGLYRSLLAGGFPAIHDRGIPPSRWLADYVATYVQRDARQVLRIGDLLAFTNFVRLCASRTAQEVNLSSLGADCGVSHNTARSWLSALEACFLVFRVPAWHRNAGKRVVKAPKMHWIDSGLVCHLLGIREEEQLRLHPLRGAIFESFVAAEILKSRVHHGAPPDLHHLRLVRGPEIDLVVERGRRLAAVECKSGETVQEEFLAPLRGFREEPRLSGGAPVDLFLAYGGSESQKRTDVSVLPWDRVADHDWS